MKPGKPTTGSTAAGCPSTRSRHREREGIVEHHELGKEMLAGFAVAEIDKHFQEDRYGHLDRHEAKRLAREQADYLWQQQYGRY
jgi:hypothetical protein